jgi:hypothetical protein
MRALLFFSMIALMTLTSTTSCQSAKKTVESGDYDAAINYCVKHLRGKKKKSDDLVRGLELAYERAQDRDMKRLDYYRRTNNLDSWDKAYNVALDIRDRQEKVEPLVPLRSKSGYFAHFDFVETDALIAESRAKASEFIYAQAQNLLRQAENGDRNAARQAYALLEDLGRRFDKNYRDRQHLMSIALRLGASNVLFSMSNASNQLLPMQFEQELMQLTSRDLNTTWKKFDTSPDRDQEYHYRAKFVLDRVEMSPEFVRENRYWDEKEVKDGSEYILDHRGNVKKDSLGFDMKRLKTAIVRAEVVEVNQRKTALVAGFLKIYDATGTQLLDSRPVSTEVVFDHLTVNFRGDERALSEKTKCNLGRAPLPFPSNNAMLNLAADQLQPVIASGLRNSRVIL